MGRPATVRRGWLFEAPPPLGRVRTRGHAVFVICANSTWAGPREGSEARTSAVVRLRAGWDARHSAHRGFGAGFRARWRRPIGAAAEAEAFRRRSLRAARGPRGCRGHRSASLVPCVAPGSSRRVEGRQGVSPPACGGPSGARLHGASERWRGCHRQWWMPVEERYRVRSAARILLIADRDFS